MILIKKSKLITASIILTIISVLVFMIFLSFNNSINEIFKAAQEEEQESGEAIGGAFGMLFLLPLLFISGGICAVFSGISEGLSIKAFTKRKENGKTVSAIVLMVINGIIILTVLLVIILLFALHAS